MSSEARFYPVEETTVRQVLGQFKGQSRNLVADEREVLISSSNYLLPMLLQQRDALGLDDTSAFTEIGITTHHFLRMQSLYNRVALPSINEIRNRRELFALQEYMKQVVPRGGFKNEEWYIRLTLEESELTHGIEELNVYERLKVCELNAAAYVYYNLRGVDQLNHLRLIRSLSNPYGHVIRI